MALALLVTFAVGLGPAGVQASGDDPEARTLIRRTLEAIPTAPFVANLRLSTEGIPPRELQLSHKLIDGSRASYLEVTAPPELRGVRFLFIERVGGPSEQYVKAAFARHSVLVADALRTQPFLESTFYVVDLVEPHLEAFDYSFVGDAQIAGRNCRLVEEVPRTPDASVYGRTIVAVDPEQLLVRKREFFDRQGQLVKVWTVDRVERIDGNWTLRDQRMLDVSDKRTSRLELIDITYGAVLDDAMFTREHLARESTAGSTP